MYLIIFFLPYTAPLATVCTVLLIPKFPRESTKKILNNIHIETPLLFKNIS